MTAKLQLKFKSQHDYDLMNVSDLLNYTSKFKQQNTHKIIFPSITIASSIDIESCSTS